MKLLSINLHQSLHKRSSTEDIFTRLSGFLSGSLVSFYKPHHFLLVLPTSYLGNAKYRKNLYQPPALPAHNSFFYRKLQTLVDTLQRKSLIDMQYDTKRLTNHTFGMILGRIGDVLRGFTYGLKLPVFFIDPCIRKTNMLHGREQLHPKTTDRNNSCNSKVLTKLHSAMRPIVNHKPFCAVIKKMQDIFLSKGLVLRFARFEMFSVVGHNNSKMPLKSKERAMLLPCFKKLKANHN